MKIALLPKTKKCIFSFYDTIIVMCVNSHQLTFIEVINGRILYTFELINFSVDKIALYRGPNKEFYLILTKLNDPEFGIYVYDVTNTAFIKTFTGHRESIEEVFVIDSQIEDAAGSSPNILILSRSKDNTCRTWSIPLSSSNNSFSYPTPITSALLTVIISHEIINHSLFIKKRDVNNNNNNDYIHNFFKIILV